VSREAMPGDASRGIEVAPVVVQVSVPNRHAHCAVCGIRIHPTSSGGSDDDACACTQDVNIREYTLISPAVLVTLPIPDASMPFNVLTLVSHQLLLCMKYS
jgi:hypothetical protein